MKFLCALLISMIIASCSQAAGPAQVNISRADGGNVTFTVERVTNDATRAQGLMFREHLDADKGMLFVYDRPMRLSFWMKNTLIPLDMLFFTAKGELVHIEPSATPESLEPRGPDRADICAVLEIAGGQAALRGLKRGDRLVLDGASACLP